MAHPHERLHVGLCADDRQLGSDVLYAVDVHTARHNLDGAPAAVDLCHLNHRVCWGFGWFGDKRLDRTQNKALDWLYRPGLSLRCGNRFLESV